MIEEHNIDMTFRPSTYWPESKTQEQLISRIKGRERQDIARKILSEHGFRELTTFLAREELTDQERDMWGKIHPSNMGDEYLPNINDGEVEIVRISLKSTTSDQISIRAKREN